MEKKRTIEDYKTAGAWMRLLKAVLSKAHIECSKVMLAKDYDRFNSIERKVDELCSRAEDNMFNEYPMLDSQHIDVFYGAPDVCTNDVDKEQIERMIRLVKELFKDNWE